MKPHRLWFKNTKYSECDDFTNVIEDMNYFISETKKEIEEIAEIPNTSEDHFSYNLKKILKI